MGEELAGSTLGEKELVAQAANGDKEAYRSLVEQYQGKVYALAFQIMRSREDAEDVAQEAFVKAYLSLSQFKGDSAFYTWLYRITYNMAIDLKRKYARKNSEDYGHEEIGLNKTPQEIVLNKEDGKHLQRLLDRLSEEHRTAIVLREVEGLSYKEIAKVLGVSRGTVMSRLFYARKKLHEGWQQTSAIVEAEAASKPLLKQVKCIEKGKINYVYSNEQQVV